MLLSVCAWAQPVDFKLTAQPLDASLREFARQSGLQIAVAPALVEGKQAPAVDARLEPEAALQRLLAGSGLTFSRRGTTIMVSKAASSQSSDQQLPEVEVVSDKSQDEGRRNPNGPPEGQRDYVVTQDTVGTKTSTPIIEIPQSISVVTRDQMDAQNVQSIAQAVGYTAGVIPGPSVYQDSFDTIYMRGFTDFGNSGQFLDGLRQLNGEFGVLRMEPYFLESVEVLKGPASVLYGQTMPGGVLNLTSKRPTAEPLHEIGAQLGTNNWRAATFDLGGPLDGKGDVLYRLTGFARATDSDIDFVQRERYSIAPSLTWKISEDTNITFLSNFQHDPKGEGPSFVPSSGSLRPNPNGQLHPNFQVSDPDFDRTKRTQSVLGYLFEHRFDDSLVVRQNLRYAAIKQDQTYLYSAGLEPDLRTLDRYSYGDLEEIRGLTLDNQLEKKFNTGAVQHTVLFGLDYQSLRHDQATGFGAAPSIDLFDPVYHVSVARPDPNGYNVLSKVSQVGAYAQDEIKVGKWVFLAGGREDWASTKDEDRLTPANTEQNDQAFTGRTGLVYLFDNGLAPYASYATSFLPQSGTSASGEAFKPKKGQQYEAGLKFQPKDYNAFVTLAAFHLTEKNQLVTDPGDPAFQIQVGETRSRGIELEGHASLANGLNLMLAYTYTDAVITESRDTATTVDGVDVPIQGKRITVVPRHAASLWADYTIRKGDFHGLGFGAGVRYLGKSDGDAANSLGVPSYAVFDVALYYDLVELDSAMKGWRFAVNATNLFDKEYIATCDGIDFCNFGQLRSVIASVRHRW
jgi:iron complex outermembrane receptor protein